MSGSLHNKKLIVFDLDGTLAPTKARMDAEMSGLITKLLQVKQVAIIGGGKYELFKEQFLDELTAPKELYKNLFLFPATSTSFYRYKKGSVRAGRGTWKKVYAHTLPKATIKKIFESFKKVFKQIGYKQPKKVYGKAIEDRGTQVTFSALGQDVVKALGEKGIDLKNKWRDENTPLKLKIAEEMRKLLPDLEIHAAGHTSIDITKKGIDKGYGMHQIEKYIGVKIKDMLFIGDAIFPGGNDYAVVRTGVDYKKVKGPEDTKKIIKNLI